MTIRFCKNPISFACGAEEAFEILLLFQKKTKIFNPSAL
jgi:hypothetical protein